LSLNPSDQIPANQNVTCYFGCIVGPTITDPSTVEPAIQAAFEATSFNVTAIDLGLLSTNCDVVGYFTDLDGAGHSGAGGQNVTESQFEAFFTSIMNGVSGLYEVTITDVELGSGTTVVPTIGDVSQGLSNFTGAISSAANSTLQSIENALPGIGIGAVAIGLLALAVVVFVWRESP
jgi:hypothetical protein